MHFIFIFETITNKNNHKHENTNCYKYTIHTRKNLKHENTYTISNCDIHEKHDTRNLLKIRSLVCTHSRMIWHKKQYIYENPPLSLSKPSIWRLILIE